MKLKQVNEGYKCPNCKNFGLEEIPNDWGPRPFINPDKPKKFKCKTCYAEFVEEN